MRSIVGHSVVVGADWTLEQITGSEPGDTEPLGDEW